MDKVEKAVIDLGGVWPGCDTRGMEDYGGKEPVLLRCRIDHGEDGDLYFGGEYYDGTVLANKSVFEVICTYPEFMEARKRLENKPGWDDAPEWAEWLAQSACGAWWWFESKPGASLGLWGSTSWQMERETKGHVFGDWRQSLEPRPESKPDQETLNPEAQQAEAWLKVCETLTRVCPNWLDLDSRAEDCAVLAIEGLVERSPFANNEHHDHKEGEGVKWEPGVDLPPVGVECEYKRLNVHYRSEFIRVNPIFFSDQICVLEHAMSGNQFAERLEDCEFRPIQTHRDKVIEALCEIANKPSVSSRNVSIECSAAQRAIIEAIADSGLVSLAGDPQ